MKLGLSLGADVPVFVYGYTAWAEGVGEKLVKFSMPEQWVVIIKPDVHVNTGQVFSTKDLTRDSQSITIADFLAGDCKNDCLAVVRKLYPAVEKALSALSFYSEARLTGTGACVFAQFASRELAEKAYSELSNAWQVYLAKGLNESLLLQKLNLL
jgi:4-diphosphocytidyl-2-C-methyl-D-erythritol kinase